MRFHLLALPGALAASSLFTSPVLARSTEREAGQEAANIELVTEFHQSVFLDHKVEESASVVADDDIRHDPEAAANENGMF
ncbi:hypothetical protein HC022_05145 [Salipiger sp. HF18]|uniref:hypothetical protein n=1 Tax=Salipiger sp. HF18 TaxID=2721557 RepID=UPI00142D2DD0|nr:hypothetical protein [Salipiger sp. HF18]NIY95656.1 hypothetical protein [Salipiger sp. HF18]